MSARPTISVALITRNEEDTLARALASVQDIASETVVVDTGSTDGTVEIAKRYGATIGHFAWCDDFAAARNAALDLCTGDWVLSLDADEELDAKTGHNLRRLVALKTAGLATFGLQIRTLNDREGVRQWGTFYATRLFPRHPTLRWRKTIHEQIEHVDDEALLTRILTSDVVIVHYGYLREEFAAKAKDERNLRILSHAIADAPDDGTLWHDLTRQHYAAGRSREAIEAAVRCIELARAQGKQNMTWAAYAYMMLVGSYLLTDQYDAGIAVGREALEWHREYSSLWANLGLCHQSKGEYADALTCFQNALTLAKMGMAYEADESVATWRTWWNIGNTYKAMGELVRAVECYWEAMDAEREIAAPRLAAAVCLSTLGEIAMARELAEGVLTRWPGQAEAEGIIMRLEHKEAVDAHR